MNTLALTKTYSAPPVCHREIMRYARCKNPDSNVLVLCNECLNEVKDGLVFKVSYIELPLKITDNVCDFGAFAVKSNDLTRNLEGCKSVIVFAATIGVAPDRLVAKYSRISPAKALMHQAIGVERIESLCDMFQNDLKATYNISNKPRFSAGYGDLPLNTQTDIFNVLNCAKTTGLTLNDNLIMSPSKSVTAFIGVL